MSRKGLAVVVTIVAFAWAGHASFAAGKDKKRTSLAVFAGGCFWCMEGPFDDVKGVLSTTSGYTGGTGKNPTYHNYHESGHAEAILVEFDASKVSYEELLQVYWHNVDPTSGDGQFCDRGKQYRPEIFYRDAAQKAAAEASRGEVEKKFGAVPVKITAATTFYPAEEYHQDFYTKDPDRYHEYRTGCGRDRRLKQLWGDAAGKAHASK
jgi:peptide-methionine (S)-S-oxide reductase